MSNTFVRSNSSAGVSKSNTNVPRPARFSIDATKRLRGLWRAGAAAVREHNDARRAVWGGQVSADERTAGVHFDLFVWTGGSSRMPTELGVPGRMRRCARQEAHYFVVRDLCEVPIELADRRESIGRV